MSEDNGGSSEEELDLTVACRDCGGTGRVDGGQLCMTCVGTGRIDPVLWREPDETAPFRDLAFSSWPAIIAGEKHLGLDNVLQDRFAPNVGHLIALLRRGEPVPRDAQRLLADLLEKLTTPKGKRKRGTPKKPPGRLEQDHLKDAIALLKAITDIHRRLVSSGSPATLTAAYAVYAEEGHGGPSSVEREVRRAQAKVRKKITEYGQILTQAGHLVGERKEVLKAQRKIALLKALVELDRGN